MSLTERDAVNNPFLTYPLFISTEEEKYLLYAAASCSLLLDMLNLDVACAKEVFVVKSCTNARASITLIDSNVTVKAINIDIFGSSLKID